MNSGKHGAGVSPVLLLASLGGLWGAGQISGQSGVALSALATASVFVAFLLFAVPRRRRRSALILGALLAASLSLVGLHFEELRGQGAAAALAAIWLSSLFFVPWFLLGECARSEDDASVLAEGNDAGDRGE